MNELVTNLKNNLTRNQKIAILVGLQIVVIIILAAVINGVFGDRLHVDIKNSGELSSIPTEYTDDFKNVLWNVVSSNYDNVEKSVIDDVVVRENSYTESKSGSIAEANFLVDIDSLKQTYNVSIQWSDEEVLPDGISVECPPVSQMKYKETFCKGMYNNTNSFSLYFPYYVYKNEYGEECTINECGDGDKSLVYAIECDENTNVINIESSICDVEKYNREALDYIKNDTPFYGDSAYTIKYTTNGVDVNC